MGIFRPGAPGTQVHVYDDNDATGGHIAGQPHVWSEINAAYPVEFSALQDAAANVYSATHKQYLTTSPLMFGHPTAGNTNATSLVDTTGADIFNKSTAGQSNLRFTNVNNTSSITFTLGTAIGSGKKMSGKQGGTIHSLLTPSFACNLNLFGCFFDGAAGFTVNNGNGVTVQIAGCTFLAGGSYALGGGGNGSFTVYNTSFNSNTTVNFCTSAAITDSYNMIWACTAPTAFFVSAAPLRKFRKVTFSGAVTLTDIRISNAPGDFHEGVDLVWSDTAGKPRIISVPITTAALSDYRTFDLKIVDPDGHALSGIPIYVESDVDGAVLDDVTEGDGNVVFTNTPISYDNVLKVRRYYDPTGSTSGATVQIEDRVFTLWVNSYKGSATPNGSYQTRHLKFEWPGRDRFGSGYQIDGGSFLPTITVVRLDPGIPTRNPIYDECEVP